MNLGTKKWKKARANFSGVRDDAGRCGTACTRACPWDAHCLPARGEIASFSKKPSFLGNHPKYVGKACSQGMQPRPWPRHASKAKAKACWPRQQQPPMGMLAKAGACSSQGQGSPHGQAAKAKACLPACCQGQGTQPRPWHACVGTLACPWVQAGGHAGMPLGAGSSKALACPVGEGVACPVGGMPRPWHALGTPTRPWQHLGGLLLPSLDSLFGHLQLFPPLKSA